MPAGFRGLPEASGVWLAAAPVAPAGGGFRSVLAAMGLWVNSAVPVAVEEETPVGQIRRIKAYRRYLARKGKEVRRVETKIARLEAKRERIVESVPAPQAMPTLRPVLDRLSALRATLSALEANVAFTRGQLEALEDDDDDLLLLT